MRLGLGLGLGLGLWRYRPAAPTIAAAWETYSDNMGRTT